MLIYSHQTSGPNLQAYLLMSDLQIIAKTKKESNAITETTFLERLHSTLHEKL